MTDIEINNFSSGNIGTTERAIRIALGMSVLMAALYMSIYGAVAYPLLMAGSTLVVLSGIAGWDPVYAMYRFFTGRPKPNAAMFKTAFTPS